MSSALVKVEAVPYRLEFRFPFRIAHGMRTGTDALLVRASAGSKHGYGEASFPPYLIPTQQSALSFFNHPALKDLKTEDSPALIFDTLISEFPQETAAIAALDMALWQLHDLRPDEWLGPKPTSQTPHTYTLGISSEKEMREKMAFAHEHNFHFFKIKLDGTHDREVIGLFRELTNAPFAVDANQGWKSLDEAKSMADFLEENGAVLIEQPFDKTNLEYSFELKKHSALPIIADESCQVEKDVTALSEAFSGINIKLHKCGGLTPAVRMMLLAKDLGMHVLIGCMSEGPVGCAAGELLAPWAKWADLDGVVLNRPVPPASTFFS